MGEGLEQAKQLGGHEPTIRCFAEPAAKVVAEQRGLVGPRGRVTVLSIKVACPLFVTQKYLLAITLILQAPTTFTSDGTSAQGLNSTTTTMQTQRVKAKKHYY
jgi:hypothetical protein